MIISDPGDAMDSYVATRLWGSIVIHDRDKGPFLVEQRGKDRKLIEIPKFSTDIVASKRVIEYMTSKGYMMRSKHMSSKNEYSIMFWKDDNRKYMFSKAKTYPMAVCVAAFAALDEKNVRQ